MRSSRKPLLALFATEPVVAALLPVAYYFIAQLNHAANLSEMAR